MHQHSGYVDISQTTGILVVLILPNALSSGFGDTNPFISIHVIGNITHWIDSYVVGNINTCNSIQIVGNNNHLVVIHVVGYITP